MELTDRAEALWASYETEVRRRLARRDDVNVADVLGGIREHVEAEASRRNVDRVTAEDLSEILETLGGPAQWGGDPGPAGSGASPAPPRWPGIAALVFTVMGGLLLLLGFWWAWAPGWGLILSGVVLARVSLEHGDPESGAVDAPGPIRRLTLLLWWTASVAALAAVLVLPAVLVWAGAQVGGALEAVLPGRPGTPGMPAPVDGYWRLPMLIGGSATAVWWLILGAVTTRFRGAMRTLLGPSRALLPEVAARGLTVGAALLVVLSLIMGVVA